MTLAELVQGFARPGVVYQEPTEPRPSLKLYQVWKDAYGRWEVVIIEPNGPVPYVSMVSQHRSVARFQTPSGHLPDGWRCLVDVASSPEEPPAAPEPPPLVTETCHVCGLRFKTPEMSRILCDYHLERAQAALARKAEWFDKRAADRRVAEKMYLCDVEKALAISPVRTTTALPIERLRPACDARNVWMMGPWR